MKIEKDFIVKSFEEINTANHYKKAVLKIGLWNSEKIIFEKYINKEDKILDIGCGAGRTTIGLYKLGYKKITGLDLSPRMIKNAININDELGYNIDYVVGDATELSYEDNSFDKAIFSFNGMMQIPKRENRLKAMMDIKRVLKRNGYFIFTTHDRDEKEYADLWNEELKRWKENKQDNRLHEFGDMIIPDKNREIFLHIPSIDEIIKDIKECGYELREYIRRSDICEESKEVNDFSTDCIFWIVEKI